jgi:hypothetical protein
MMMLHQINIIDQLIISSNRSDDLINGLNPIDENKWNMKKYFKDMVLS